MITFFSRTFLLSLLLFLHVFALTAFSADFKLPKSGSGKEEPMVIKSNTLEIDNEKKTVTFTGNVDARKDDWIMNCDKMVLMYNGQTGKSGVDKEKLSVDKIIANGSVRIKRAPEGEATAGEAIYYQADERIVLTGSPVVKQGDDFVEGSKITLFLKENRSIVEGSEKTKVRAVIAPRSGQR